MKGNTKGLSDVSNNKFLKKWVSVLVILYHSEMPIIVNINLRCMRTLTNSFSMCFINSIILLHFTYISCAHFPFKIFNFILYKILKSILTLKRKAHTHISKITNITAQRLHGNTSCKSQCWNQLVIIPRRVLFKKSKIHVILKNNLMLIYT